MPSPLVDAHIEALARLRSVIAEIVARLWNGLPGHDRKDVDEWLTSVVPVIGSAQRSSVALTEAYIANYLDRQPLGVNVDDLIGAKVRGGTSPDEVYRRPFVTLWSALGEGVQYEDALKRALERAQSASAIDVQLSMRATAEAVQKADPGIYGYARKADPGACSYCQLLDGAYVKQATAFPMHNHCGCGLEPLTEPHSRAVLLPSGVAVHEHGELGSVITAPGDRFTTEAQALA